MRRSRGREFGCKYGSGDVIGCLIELPSKPPSPINPKLLNVRQITSPSSSPHLEWLWSWLGWKSIPLPFVVPLLDTRGTESLPRVKDIFLQERRATRSCFSSFPPPPLLPSFFHSYCASSLPSSGSISHPPSAPPSVSSHDQQQETRLWMCGRESITRRPPSTTVEERRQTLAPPSGQ